MLRTSSRTTLSPANTFEFTAGISEDSDYTSDVSFPIHHQPNSSAHQWDSHLHPHRYRHHPKDTTLQASYEDEEDAYHARPDPYHESAHHRYDSDYGRLHCSDWSTRLLHMVIQSWS
ncbi:hypothetical protein ANCCAN_20550 [Ancylostoma caninum]|uniref:Uncharacterized protein n=1 Tax=Ancylostoma caninum TaxID=29170 RepID=A0A368FQ15_ANCCA|nr:hypothetical protein ANCCAN_20550 [Ancylostoma caninum]